MSFFDAGKKRFNWVPSLPPQTSVRPDPGCVQCGSQLEPTGFGQFNYLGTCFSCSCRVSEDDEDFEELEE
ncbi:MAG TPA: hypothetical protein VNC39_14825 [Acidocella sp.]|jgi:hypothetical protein|uniref:hypothetical protein n=1 Tax=Acidocella sp. TaxID=50710 RepID=UPI002D1905D1|nr:hypothetical protein [Acidocella sp.]HVE23243.1 hypothetical protein [Acidocella sp.]